MIVAFLIGLTLHISKDNNPKIFYAKINDGFAFLLIDSDTIYDIAPNVNKKVINKKRSIQSYIDSIRSANIYLPIDLPKTKFVNDFNIAISESYPEINYLSDEKMRYDISIDSKGRVNSNIFYPDNKKGGYTFVTDENDLKVLKRIIYCTEIQNITNNHFINNHYNTASIIINKKVMNHQIFSDKNLSSIIMFANYITMKYITNLDPTPQKFNIPSSNYTLIGPPPPSSR